MDHKRRRVLRLLKEKYCPIWPRCCYQHLLRYQELLENEERDWSFEQLQAAETMIFESLSCTGANCPDPDVRRYATVQLLNPFWNRQRRGKELTEEEFILGEWDQRTRHSKLASVLYPGLTSETTQAEMRERSNNERKRAPAAARLLDDHSRGALSPLDGRMK